MINPDIKANPTNWTVERHWLFDGEEQHRADRAPIEELLADPAYVARVEKEALRRQLYMMVDWPYESMHFGLMAVLEYPTDVSEAARPSGRSNVEMPSVSNASEMPNGRAPPSANARGAKKSRPRNGSDARFSNRASGRQRIAPRTLIELQSGETRCALRVSASDPTSARSCGRPLISGGPG